MFDLVFLTIHEEAPILPKQVSGEWSIKQIKNMAY